ncbi:hypothetical protein H180DRAFT_01157 [Streptomyces sp. WMMB 322]|nr:hypothetical protein H180DRAFT_01157 [Streptomyces sp. WMMB 322]
MSVWPPERLGNEAAVAGRGRTAAAKDGGGPVAADRRRQPSADRRRRVVRPSRSWVNCRTARPR